MLTWLNAPEGGYDEKNSRNGLQLADDDIIRGDLDIVTDKTKKKNKPKAEQETAQPMTARFNYLEFEIWPLVTDWLTNPREIILSFKKQGIWNWVELDSDSDFFILIHCLQKL